MLLPFLYDLMEKKIICLPTYPKFSDRVGSGETKIFLNVALPQSKRLLIMAVDCLNESLEASEVDGSFPMPPTITRDWVPSRADIKS